MNTLRVLTALCLASLFAGCSNVPFGGQEFSYRHDEENDRLLVFQHYQNLGGSVDGGFPARIAGLAAGTLTYGFAADRGSFFSSSYHFEPRLLKEYLAEVRGDDGPGREGWRSSLVPEPGGSAEPEPAQPEDELDHALRQEEQREYLRKQQIAFLEQVLVSVEIGPATFYVNEWGQLCAYQPVMVNEFSKLVKRADQLLDRWISSPANRFVSEADKPVVERFARKRDWIQVTGNQIKIQFPLSLSAFDEATLADNDSISLVLIAMSDWEVVGDILKDASFLHYDEPIMGLTLGAKSAEAVHLQSDNFNTETLGNPELIGYAAQLYGLATDPTVVPEVMETDTEAEPEEPPTPLDEMRDAFLAAGDAPPALVVAPDARSAQTAELLATLAARYAAAGMKQRRTRAGRSNFEQAAKAAEASLKLDEHSPMAHLALAESHLYGSWDAAAAEAAYRRVVALDPQDADSRHNLAWLRGVRGHTKTAIRDLRRLLGEDLGDQSIGEAGPGGAHVWGELADFLSYAGRHDEAVEAADEMVAAARAADQQLERRQAERALIVAYRHMAASRPAEATETIDCKDPGIYMALAACAIAYHRAGDTDRAWDSLNRLTTAAESAAATEVAIVLTQWGQTEAAFWWLERAYASRDGSLWRLMVHPWFEPVRDDPRYVELVDRLGLSRELPEPDATDRMQAFSLN